MGRRKCLAVSMSYSCFEKTPLRIWGSQQSTIHHQSIIASNHCSDFINKWIKLMKEINDDRQTTRLHLRCYAGISSAIATTMIALPKSTPSMATIVVHRIISRFLERTALSEDNEKKHSRFASKKLLLHFTYQVHSKPELLCEWHG